MPGPARSAVGWLAATACLWLATACAEPPRRAFFATCQQHDQCGSGLCVHGVCTRSCAAEAECDEGVCVEQVCVPFGRVECAADAACAAVAAGSACKTPVCAAGRCAFVAAAAGAACPAGCAGDSALAGTCAAGRCEPVPGAAPASCDDDQPCTTDGCGATGCEHAPAAGACDDGDACTQGDACQQGTCQAGAEIACDDGQACTTNTCDAATGCQFAPVVGPCDDGNACTQGDSCLCVPGAPGRATCACTGGGAVACDDGNACTGDACDPVAGCTHAVTAGAQCDDGDPCSVGDTCTGGACKGKPLLWMHTYGLGLPSQGNAVEVTDSLLVVAGTVVAGTDSQARIVATSHDDAPKWDVLIDGAGQESAEAVAALGSGFVVAGWTTTGSLGGEDGWLLLLDGQGKQVAQQVLGTAGQERLRSVAAFGAGVAAAGVRHVSGAPQPWLVTADAAGKGLADKVFSQQGAGEATVVLAPAGGGLLVAGTTSSGQGFALRLDDALVPIWAHSHGEGTGFQIHAAVALADGFALAGRAPDAAMGSAMWLVRTDAAGLVLWQKTYAVAHGALARGLTADATGFGLAGHGAPAAGQADDVWGVRTDGFGNLQFDRTHALVGEQTVRAAARLPDGGLAMTGSLAAGGPADIVVFRTNRWGIAICGEVGKCLSLLPEDCDDGKPCTAENCVGTSGCVHTPLAAGAQCGASVCVPVSTCQGPDMCMASVQADCDDLNPCTVDGCGETGCSHAFSPDGAGCPGGKCFAGECVVG